MWLVFILWSTVLNVFFCLGLAGPAELMAVYESALPKDFTLVCVFSFLWGSGTMCYSLGVQMVSVGVQHTPSCVAYYSIFTFFRWLLGERRKHLRSLQKIFQFNKAFGHRDSINH